LSLLADKLGQLKQNLERYESPLSSPSDNSPAAVPIEPDGSPEMRVHLVDFMN
jgi:hypothetical protein